MGPGITLVVLGAILTFAVRTEATAVDLQTVGVIFMLAGAAIIAYARREKEARTERVVTEIDEDAEGVRQAHTVREVVTHEVVDDDTGLGTTAHGYDSSLHGTRP